MNPRPTVSLIVAAYNEAELIGQCLGSAKSFCDELVLIDSSSTDATVAIAQGLGARVYQQEFTDYVRQKQAALDRATGDWVLLLDADEQATADLGREIRAAISAPDGPAGYQIRRMLYHLGHYYKRRIYRDFPVRLFRRDQGHIGGIDPHDKVIVRGRVGRLKSPILHFSYRDVADHVATINRLSTRGAAQVEPSPLVALQMFTHPLWRFLNFYLLRGGFLEGGRGLYAAISAAFYVFLKYAKIYEKRMRGLRPR